MTSRSVVLIFARVTNYAVLLLSPIILTRILDVKSYGQYREFVLYAFVVSAVLAFSSKGNLLFFIPKNPEKERAYAFNTIVFLLVTTTTGLLLLYLSQDLFVQHINFSLIDLLIIYVWLFVNLDLMQTFWLARKRSDYVFIYTATLLLFRMGAIILSAYYTQDVTKIIYSMILIEGVKFALLAFWWIAKFGMKLTIDREAAAEQLKYTLPLGTGGLVDMLNQKFGSLFITANLGVSALAIYSIGAYQIPVLSIVRSAVSDVIFPEMVQHNEKNQDKAVLLWQRANVVFCVIVFPVFAMFFVNAEPFITSLFTQEYSASVPVFQLMLFMMVRRCFELGTPLRSKNLNKYFFRATIIALTINVAITLALFDYLGLVTPAVALVIADAVMGVYLASRVLKVYSLHISELFMWNKLGRIVIATAAGIPVLMIGDYQDANLARLISVIIYCLIYYWFVRYYRFEEVETIVRKLAKRAGLTV